MMRHFFKHIAATPLVFVAAFFMFGTPEAPGATLASIDTVGGCAHAEGDYRCSYNPNPRAASPGHDCTQCESLQEERDANRTGAYVMGATAAVGSVTLPIIGAVAGVTAIILVARADSIEDEMEALGC